MSRVSEWGVVMYVCVHIQQVRTYALVTKGVWLTWWSYNWCYEVTSDSVMRCHFRNILMYLMKYSFQGIHFKCSCKSQQKMWLNHAQHGTNIFVYKYVYMYMSVSTYYVYEVPPYFLGATLHVCTMKKTWGDSMHITYNNNNYVAAAHCTLWCTTYTMLICAIVC